MLIDKVECIPIEIPLIEPFETSYGHFDSRQIVIVKVYSEGEVSFAECPVFGPFYSYETVHTTLYVIQNYLAPAIQGSKIANAKEFLDKVSFVRGYPMAKSALEMAIWDLKSREQNQSLSRLLGGEKEKVQVGISIGIPESKEVLLQKVARAVERGYARIKIKIKPGWDVEPVKVLKEQFPELLLMVDANASFSLQDISTLKALDKYHLLMIEQPLNYSDLFEHATLQKQLRTPICLDESIHTEDDISIAAAMPSAHIINIKVARVGGLLNALRIYNKCKEGNLGTWVGGMVETDIGKAYNLAFASLKQHNYPHDITPSGTYFPESLVEPVIAMDQEGYIKIPIDKSGIGYHVNEEFIEHYRMNKG